LVGKWEFEPEALHDFVFFFLIFEEVLSECGFGLFVLFVFLHGRIVYAKNEVTIAWLNSIQ
jgi:hypothetical protein